MGCVHLVRRLRDKEPDWWVRSKQRPLCRTLLGRVASILKDASGKKPDWWIRSNSVHLVGRLAKEPDW